MYDHILITTDGSDLAQRGVDQGLSLAKALGSKVTILTVTERFPVTGSATGAGWVGSPEDFERYDKGQKEFADGILSAVKAEAGKMDISARTLHVPNERPATAILEAVASLDCDLIVMASHGRRGIRRMLLGSQTAEVLADSHTPVLVVR